MESKKRPTSMQNALHLGFFIGGGDRNRTDDLLRAKQALSRLSYTPTEKNENLVGRSGLEPLTSRLSAECSSRLSYRPTKKKENSA